MATTLTNTTFLFLCVILVALLVRLASRGEDQAGAWMTNAIERMAKSKLLKIVLMAGVAVGMGSRILVGYLGPGDFFQDYIGAKEFAAGRSFNPASTMPERVEYWLHQEPVQIGALSRWPALQRLQTNSINSGARQLVVQAHPPFHILLIAPVVELCRSIQGTFVALTIINIAAYIFLLRLVWRGTSLPAIVPASAAGLVWLLALDWQPLLANLRQAQIGLVVALLVTAAWYLLSRGQDWPAGILIGLAALIKLYPALLIFWLLLRRRRAFASALITVSVAVLGVYLIGGRQAFLDYYNAAKTVEEIFGRVRINYSLSAVISFVVAGATAKSIWASAAILLVDAGLFGYSAFLVLRHPKPSQREMTLEFSCYVVLACLLSPTVEAFYYPILLLPIAAVASMIRPETLLRGSIALLAILWCFSFPDQIVVLSTGLLTRIIGDRLAWLLCSFPTFALLALWYWIVRGRRTVVNWNEAVTPAKAPAAAR